MSAALSQAARASKRLIHAAFSYPIMGRLRADPGEKHEPRVAASSSATIQHLPFVAYQSFTTGALAAAESDLRLLTTAAIEKRTLSAAALRSRRHRDSSHCLRSPR